MKIEVELDVFSGRPNPRWDLDADTEAEVLAILQRDAHAAASAPAPVGLGYRGFVLRISGGTLLSAREVRVCQGVASVSEGGGARHVLAAGLEELLLDAAIRAGHEALLKTMRP